MKGKKQKEPVGFNPAEIFAALELLEKERGIPQSFMMDKIIQALTTAYKRDHDGVENVIVDVDEAHHTLKMFVQKNVVAEEDYVDPANEILVDEAKHISARYNVGDVINLPVDNVEFGRIAAGNGKQVIIQGLREAERGMVYDEFNSKQHEILTGVVTRIDPRNGNVSLRIGTGSESTEALLMAGEQVPGEELTEGMHVKVYVVEVRRSTRGPQVLISRTHPGLVKRLFELEVPEIYDGTVEVRSIAREAGSRTKMAVWSNDENVDPIGACVGPKGQRVAAIVEELRGEKIDIIKWSEDPAQFIAAALAPADVVDVWMADEGKACRCVVPDDQLSLAIGKEGQNARLAARLTGYKIDIKPQSYRDPEEEPAGAEEPAATENSADAAQDVSEAPETADTVEE
ncbi:transcription termination factor NusA [uncultured Oscillibacter sp.]|uniref:transcription termination factor NusA n=1 Tax=uncultured Oscillibacter sp. TaxID=876091 RepID=UPI0025F2E2DA|nr:transcription termination factor NusA [uncultured Oscillibacter sp.]